MTLTSDIQSLRGNDAGVGTDSWREQLKKEWVGVSPGGDIFVASYTKSNFSLPKKLGIFPFVNRAGSAVQDLDVDSLKYTVDIIFSGDRCITDAFNFLGGVRQKGNWTITDPAYPEILRVKIISASFDYDFVKSANVVIVKTSWIEESSAISVLTPQILASQIELDVTRSRAAALDAFTKKVKISALLLNGVKDAFDLVTGIADKVTTPLKESLLLVSNLQVATLAGIQAVKLATIFEAEQLAAMTQNLIGFGSAGANKLSEKVAVYRDMIDQYQSKLPKGTDEDASNKASVIEIGLGSALDATALSVARTDISNLTRGDALQIAEDLGDSYDKAMSALQSMQDSFGDNDIDKQFAIDALSADFLFANALRARDLVLLKAYDAQATVTIKLLEPTSPVQFVMEYKGTTGNNNEELARFLSQNKLYGDEIMQVPAGREVSIYV